MGVVGGSLTVLLWLVRGFKMDSLKKQKYSTLTKRMIKKEGCQTIWSRSMYTKVLDSLFTNILFWRLCRNLLQTL